MLIYLFYLKGRGKDINVSINLFPGIASSDRQVLQILDGKKYIMKGHQLV